MNRVDVLKIDAQGADLDVLRGAGTLLIPSTIGCVVVELVHARLYDGQGAAEDITTLLRDAGYRLAGLYNAHLDPVGRVRWVDAVFVDAARAG